MLVANSSEEKVANTSQQSAQNSDVVLSVESVSKKFCRDLKRSLIYGMQDITSETLNLRSNENITLRKKEFWALQDVSFSLRRGEAVGLVGKNGSGKSTMLRVIAGLIKPDMGSVMVSGRVAPLIALGAGFNPILTGRENIYTNMSILGLTKQEITERFEDVVNFAEIGDAIDSPVQTYSTGMQSRLGFACAINTNADILLIDEVLSVGDTKFQSRCFHKLNELRNKGTAFILVSHSSHSVATVCDRAVYLKKGQKIVEGPVASVLSEYENNMFLGETGETHLGEMSLPAKPEADSAGLDIASLSFRNHLGERVNSPATGQSVSLILECLVHKPLTEVSFSVKARKVSLEGEYLMYMNSQDDNYVYPTLQSGKYQVQLELLSFGLGVGLYDFKVEIYSQGLVLLDKVESFKFEVKASQSQSCQSAFFQPHSWNIVDKGI